MTEVIWRDPFIYPNKDEVLPNTNWMLNCTNILYLYQELEALKQKVADMEKVRTPRKTSETEQA